jgi:hypothetical protein
VIVVGPPNAERRFGVASGLRIQGWGEASDVVYVGWARETHQVEAGAAEVLRWLMQQESAEGTSLRDLAAAFDGLLVPAELEALASDLTRLGLLWCRDHGT